MVGGGRVRRAPFFSLSSSAFFASTAACPLAPISIDSPIESRRRLAIVWSSRPSTRSHRLSHSSGCSAFVIASTDADSSLAACSALSEYVTSSA